jgi:cytochrome c-type biogenesis protein CcmH
MSAQSWADYADVLSALASGSLSGEAGAAIDSALSVDAWNPKAMGLKASQEHQQHNEAEAIVWWRRLRAVLPPDSPEVPIINAKIAEAEALMNGTPSAASMPVGR